MRQANFISYYSKNQKSFGLIHGQKGHSPFFSPILQPQLTINPPGDIYEQEADAMADKVMRMAENERDQQPFLNLRFHLYSESAHIAKGKSRKCSVKK